MTSRVVLPLLHQSQYNCDLVARNGCECFLTCWMLMRWVFQEDCLARSTVSISRLLNVVSCSEFVVDWRIMGSLSELVDRQRSLVSPCGVQNLASMCSREFVDQNVTFTTSGNDMSLQLIGRASILVEEASNHWRRPSDAAIDSGRARFVPVKLRMNKAFAENFRIHS